MIILYIDDVIYEAKYEVRTDTTPSSGEWLVRTRTSMIWITAT